MSTAIAPVENLSTAELDQLCINTIRTLSIDAVQQANSGHPGTPMALAPLVYTIWNRALTFDPQDPIWPNRDRFVLSNGHASMLLWSALHLTGVQAVNATTKGWDKLQSRLMIFGASANSTARLPDIPNTIGSQVSKPRLALWGRVWPRALAWQSLKNGSPAATTGLASTSSTTTFIASVVTDA